MRIIYTTLLEKSLLEGKINPSVVVGVPVARALQERLSDEAVSNARSSGIDVFYEEQEELSPISVGIAWGSRILAFSLEFALLVAFGYMIDEHYGFKPWALLICAAIGVCSFVSGIVLTAKRMERVEARIRKANDSSNVDEGVETSGR